MKIDLNKNFTSLKHATLINAFSKYSTVLLSLVFSAVLARLLTPEEFGVVGVVTVFVNFFNLFADMGIGTAVIQNKELSRKDTERIFGFTLLLGVALCAVFSACSFLMVRLYGNEVYYTVGPLLGVGLMLATFNVVPNAHLMKNKLFVTNAVRVILSCLIGYCVAIVAALHGWKYYSIVFQQLTAALFVLCWNLATVRLRPDFHAIGESMKKIRHFSTYQFAFNFINYFSRNLDNLLTGYYFGEAQLGYYDKAYRLMRYPVDNLTNVITPSMLPILSEHQKDINYVFEKYRTIVKLLGVIAVYISVVCFFASKEIILLYFGRQWNGAVMSFHLLSVSLFFQIVGGISGSIYQTVNKTKEMFISGIIGTVITVAGILVGISLGSIDGLALAYSVAFVLNFIKSQWFLSRFCFNQKFWRLLSMFKEELLIAAAMCAALSFVPAFESLLLSLIVKAGAGLAVYAVMLALTREYRALLPILPVKIRKKWEERIGHGDL